MVNPTPIWYTCCKKKSNFKDYQGKGKKNKTIRMITKQYLHIPPVIHAF